MELCIRICFGLLALLHVLPAFVFFSPSLAERLYDVPLGSSASILIIHRGALFCVICLMVVWAIFDPAVRYLAIVGVFISMAGFLFVYWQQGLPAGSLRTIALADVAGLLILAIIVWADQLQPSQVD